MQDFQEPGWIGLEPRNHAVFEVLTSFVDKASAGSFRIEQLAAATATALQSIGTQDPTFEQYQMESRVFFAILLTLLQQIDADAAEQEYLIELVVLLSKLPLPASVLEEIDEEDWMKMEMNTDLSNFKNIWSGISHDAPLHPRLDDRDGYIDHWPNVARPPWRQAQWRYMSARSWGNLNAFLARLHTAAPDSTHLDLHGLYAMIEALEEPRSPSQLEDVLPAAAYWIIYAGNALRNNNVPYAFYSVDEGFKRLPWGRGSLWNGQHPFSEERWEFWMQRFRTIAEREDIDQELKRIAWRAFEAGSRSIRAV